MVIDEEAGLVYVQAGSGSDFGNTNLNDLFEFNLHFNTWRMLQFTVPAADVERIAEDESLDFLGRYGHSTVLYKRRLYCFGGTHGVQV